MYKRNVIINGTIQDCNLGRVGGLTSYDFLTETLKTIQ